MGGVVVGALACAVGCFAAFVASVGAASVAAPAARVGASSAAAFAAAAFAATAFAAAAFAAAAFAAAAFAATVFAVTFGAVGFGVLLGAASVAAADGAAALDACRETPLVALRRLERPCCAAPRRRRLVEAVVAAAGVVVAAAAATSRSEGRTVACHRSWPCGWASSRQSVLITALSRLVGACASALLCCGTRRRGRTAPSALRRTTWSALSQMQSRSVGSGIDVRSTRVKAALCT